MIIGKDMRGSPRIKLSVHEYEGSQSTGNMRNRTYSLYEPTFEEVYNEVGKILFDNFDVGSGKKRSEHTRIRVRLEESTGPQQTGVQRNFSLYSTSVTQVRNALEETLKQKFGE